MKKEANWKNYLWIGLIGFLAFLLEYFTIFVIDGWLLNVDIFNYTPHQRGVHCIITAAVWLAVIIGMLAYTRTQYGFPVRIGGRTEKIAARDWAAALACFAGCKILTFLDWHTWKVIGEAKGKDVFQFCSQYLYYLLEVGLVLLIIVYTMVLNKVLMSGNVRIQVKVVTRHYERINRLIAERLDCGTSLLHMETGYLHKEQDMILAVIARRDLPRLNQLVMDQDPEAFMIINQINEVRGRGFTMKRVYQDAAYQEADYGDGDQ